MRSRKYSLVLTALALMFFCFQGFGCRTGHEMREDLDVAPLPDPDEPTPEGMALIHGGTYTIGSNDGPVDERPVHAVLLDPYYIDVHEVTNADYQRFVEATGYRAEGLWREYAGAGREDHPVVAVTWNDAVAYATWAGKQLPTEAQWEVAARGGLEGMAYPNGQALAPTDATYGYFGDEATHTSPVGSHPPNGYGLFDTAGNAWEWCSDYYVLDAYARPQPRNPPGPERGATRVLRGGSWNDRAEDLRVANRLGMTPTLIGHVIGFRCCRPIAQRP